MLLTSPHRSRISEVESLFVKARTTLTLLEFERAGTLRFVPADHTKAWDYTDPVVEVDPASTPDAVGLNDVFKKLPKFNGKQVSALIGQKKLDPAKGVLQELARQGVITGGPSQYRLVATDALDTLLDDLGLALRGQRTVQRQDRVLLEVIEAINASKLLLGSQRPDWSMSQFSDHIHEHPSGHPVVAELNTATSSMTGLMEKSKMAALSEQAVA